MGRPSVLELLLVCSKWADSSAHVLAILVMMWGCHFA